MKKRNWLIAIFIIFLIISVGIYYFIKTSPKASDSSYEANKTYASDDNTSNTSVNEFSSSYNTIPNNNEKNTEELTQGITNSASHQVTQETLSSFTTKIYSKDSARQNNIQITCKTLNGTIIKTGSIFSFCNTVGQATSSKGYQKADIYDNDGKKKKGLGGGNCQVSSTLYNAVLKVDSLYVTERHSHSNTVPYVKKGKDAAVAYGSYDLKFKNNSGNDIKIEASTNGQTVTISLIKI